MGKSVRIRLIFYMWTYKEVLKPKNPKGDLHFGGLVTSSRKDRERGEWGWERGGWASWEG